MITPVRVKYTLPLPLKQPSAVAIPFELPFSAPVQAPRPRGGLHG